jgi:hypothetical protein
MVADAGRARARTPVTCTQILLRRICRTSPWVHVPAEKGCHPLWLWWVKLPRRFSLSVCLSEIKSAHIRDAIRRGLGGKEYAPPSSLPQWQWH